MCGQQLSMRGPAGAVCVVLSCLHSPLTTLYSLLPTPYFLSRTRTVLDQSRYCKSPPAHVNNYI